MKVFSLMLFLTTVSLFSHNSTKTCEILSKINVLIQREHISPKPIDDSLSVYIFDAFIDELDPARNLFLKSDYDLLSKKYRLNIDNLILAKDCSFLTEIKSVLQKSLLRNKLILEKINKEAIDYQYKDTIRLYKKAFPIYLLDDEVEKVLSKKIRYEIQVGRHIFEVDEFYGENKGLIMAEVELQSETETFETPIWLGEEVTNDNRYYNSYLSQHPFTSW